MIVINPVPAWPAEAEPVRTGIKPQRLAIGEFLRSESDAAPPEFLGQLRSFGITAADVRASRPVVEFVRAGVVSEFSQAGHELAAVEDAEVAALLAAEPGPCR